MSTSYPYSGLPDAVVHDPCPLDKLSTNTRPEVFYQYFQYTDPSNFERFRITKTSRGVIIVAYQARGTGRPMPVFKGESSVREYVDFAKRLDPEAWDPFSTRPLMELAEQRERSIRIADAMYDLVFHGIRRPSGYR